MTSKLNTIKDCPNEIQMHELIDDPFKNEKVPYGNNEMILCLNIAKFYSLSDLPFLGDFQLRDGEGIKMYLMKIHLLVQSIELQIGFINVRKNFSAAFPIYRDIPQQVKYVLIKLG